MSGEYSSTQVANQDAPEYDYQQILQDTIEHSKDGYYTFENSSVKSPKNSNPEDIEVNISAVPASNSPLKSRMRSEIPTKSLMLSGEEVLNPVWSIPDSSKDFGPYDKHTGYHFHCQGCENDPHYHAAKRLPYNQ